MANNTSGPTSSKLVGNLPHTWVARTCSCLMGGEAQRHRGTPLRPSRILYFKKREILNSKEKVISYGFSYS
ncbi:hypothetical protein EUGRSUZ_C01730 [Eucalyptus grandis]|uniref:Uncharacterized protein n=2 Tax=Eucalyptus grandis TaxID=71139 RepID=A0ACC3LE71_EUCGR|nr:hypothetical protein EUGRSUZ_C01730 [Eucalyptus grandis]